MLLVQQVKESEVCREVEAFQATCVVFKVKIVELAMASGVDRQVIERFHSGAGDISTTTLFKILRVLTPTERSFYNSMMSIQYAACDAGITLPLLNFTPLMHDNAYRDALDLTFRIFGINQKDVCVAAGMQSGNFSAWMTGKRDVTLPLLARIKNALSREQRVFYESVADIYISLEPYATERAVPTTNKHLNIA